MIPYFEWSEVHIGPLTLYVWGFFVALGILVGLQIAHWYAKRQNLQEQVVVDAVIWGIIGGLLGARLGYALFYNPALFIAHPFQLIALWDGGMSMAGALLGAIFAIVLYLRKKQVPVLSYLDALTFGLPLGYGCGRIGCFLIHDHPGTATNFLLGVKYPDGIVRHDHGLYLSLFGFVTAGIFFLAYAVARARGKKIPAGLWTGLYFVLYGTVRIWLDFYRTADAVYFSLTPAQWVSIVFIACGLTLIVYSKKSPVC